MHKRSRRKRLLDFSGLHMFLTIYCFLSLGVRIVLLFKLQSTVKAVLFAALWLGVIIMVLRDPRPSRRSREAVYSGIAVMLVLPAICAFLLGYAFWGAAGLAEATACLLVLRHVHGK